MKQDVNEIIRQLAKRDGVSEQEVIDEMQKAIDAGYGSINPAVRSQWAAMPFKSKPTPQAFILYMAGRLRNRETH